MGNCKVIRAIFLLGVLFLESTLLGLTLTLLLVPPPVQAAATISWSNTTLQSSTAYTVYLPIIYRPLASEGQLVDLINAERTRRGLGTVSINSLLMQVAEAHSQDMVDRDFFSHINPDGQDPGDRLDDAGYNWLTYGETIGGGYKTAQAMFNGWMNSPGHSAILLNPNFTEIGIGYVTGGDYNHYWTAILATPLP